MCVGAKMLVIFFVYLGMLLIIFLVLVNMFDGCMLQLAPAALHLYIFIWPMVFMGCRYSILKICAM